METAQLLQQGDATQVRAVTKPVGASSEPAIQKTSVRYHKYIACVKMR